MPENPQIHAVGDVLLEAPPHRAQGMRGFYCNLIGLGESADESEPSQVVFEAHGRRVTVRVFADAMASPMRRRLMIQVDSLEQTAAKMRKFGVACHLHSGMGVGDRRLVTLDPAGNRVEIKEVRLL